MMRRLVPVFALTSLSACTSGVPVPGDAADTATPVGQSADPRTQTLDVMLERARSSRMGGDLAEAESTLEAALRIAPGDARLWLELAEVQFAAGEFEESRTLAERAISLSGGDAQTIEAAQRIRALTAP
ncbi:MAG: tetratricopeptide repeat protein [Gammaproteobacteria bacterium]|jgi:Flp pilus assembly protein TadD